jgi:SAM-dependent methyltransferase
MEQPGTPRLIHEEERLQYNQSRARYWERYALAPGRWERTRSYYRERLREIYRFLIPPGLRVPELGCGNGDLLASPRPSRGLGVDICPAMVERARAAYRDHEFRVLDVHRMESTERFDVIVCSDLLHLIYALRNGPGESGSAVDHLVTPETLG